MLGMQITFFNPDSGYSLSSCRSHFLQIFKMESSVPTNLCIQDEKSIHLNTYKPEAASIILEKASCFS